MMRKICTFLLTLCACLLTACGGTGEATGRVVAMDVRDGEGLVSFTVETEKGEQIALELTEGTHIFSFIEGLDPVLTGYLYPLDPAAHISTVIIAELQILFGYVKSVG